MITEIFPFAIKVNTVAIAGASLWSLALYLAFSPLREKIIELLNRWFNFAERFLYTSQTEFEKTRPARESQNAFYASLFSIIPFLVVGALSNWAIDISLGRSWGISMGIMACIISAIYELGRQSAESEEEE
ncbi:hypothetical protein NWP17_11715 [Chrysosporum bergii ANA360D]|jgi:hypothetical protein|uniref:Uncharacterized protein n=1 Tax=Chrysosporum bergii ANA360D TaxID=617107 RepID=A0AA43GU57_9CYAN|nr:hypothetical protein [Chrysosporum bergii]MDH6061097.1 hypothetical protein [Chrysosporum bergii ANA360D]